jgi:hypothetical protein
MVRRQHDRTADLGSDMGETPAEFIATRGTERLFVELGLENQFVAEGRDSVTTVKTVKVRFIATVDLRLSDE